MNRVINKHQNNNTIFAKKLLVLITGYLISKICYSKIYHFLKVYKEPYMNKAILTLPHSRAIYSASIREGFNWLRTNRNWKTAAFAIPIIHQLHRIVGSSKSQIRALVVTPTRELVAV
jgi:hypothetical protein